MPRRYEAWECADGFAFFASDQLATHEADPTTRLVRKLFECEAHTGEEALSIYHLRMGWGPYTPAGNPAPCPRCGAWFYPEGSGDCWRCGNVG